MQWLVRLHYLQQLCDANVHTVRNILRVPQHLVRRCDPAGRSRRATHTVIEDAERFHGIALSAGYHGMCRYAQAEDSLQNSQRHHNAPSARGMLLQHCA